MDLVKRLKAAADICSGSEELAQMKITPILFSNTQRIRKLSKGEAERRKNGYKGNQMVKEAQSDGVERSLKGDER